MIAHILFWLGVIGFAIAFPPIILVYIAIVGASMMD
jgi:hypothetical protein